LAFPQCSRGALAFGNSDRGHARMGEPSFIAARAGHDMLWSDWAFMHRSLPALPILRMLIDSCAFYDAHTQSNARLVSYDDLLLAVGDFRCAIRSRFGA